MVRNETKAELYNKNEVAFEEIFKKHFRELHSYAFALLKDWDVAEEIVQGMFLSLWEKDKWDHIQISIRAYLYKSVYNQSMNHIRRGKIHLKYQNTTAYHVQKTADDTSNRLLMGELEIHLEEALKKLPEKCSAVFHLSRFEDLKYHQIADQLSISVKTVETHMGKALRILRKELKEFLPMIALIILNMFKS